MEGKNEKVSFLSEHPCLSLINREKLRALVDYCSLNRIVKPNHASFPRIHAMKYFTV